LNDEGRNDDERNHEYSRKDFKAEYIDLLNHDYEILCELCDRWAKNTEDPKLDVFKEKLNSKLFNSETNTSHKLVIFSEAIDTVETIKRVAENKGYKVLMVTAANRNTLEHVIRENFDANYGKKDGEVQKNDYDVIVTTEVLAEGINLHRANVILNYDTPWNSTRLMQRIGRVNRIGTNQDFVYVYNFKPSDEGDAEIKLVQKAYTKLQSFHTLFGEDNKVYTEEEEVSHYDLNTMVNGEESPLEKYIYELKKFKEENPERYEYILNRDNDLEVATTFIDGCSYFHVKTPRMAGLYVKVDPTNNKGKVISAAEMYQSFAVSKEAPTVSLPEDWEEQKKKAELSVNKHLHKLNVRKAKSNNATKAKEILIKMRDNITMSEKSKSLLDDAFRFVNKGNTDIIKKVLAFDKYVNTSPNDLFGGLSQQDFDDMIEREISNIVSTLQQRYGKAEVFIGLSK
jgi:superfamily II DNA/RNA helicase